MTPWRRRISPDGTPPSDVKRGYQRYLLDTRLTAIAQGDEPRVRVQSRSLDISETGLGALFHETWEPGSRIDLEISLPAGATPLRVEAIVRHRTGFRYGLEFVNVSTEQRTSLRDTCKSLATRPG